jgi:hypothetical protein
MRSTILILITALLLLAACQPVPPTAAPEAATPMNQETVEPYPPQPVITQPPSVQSGYPEPQVQPPSSGQSAYPEPGTGQYETITWEEATNLILEGNVSQVTQLHNLTVFLTLKDGTMLETVEPAIDDVFNVIDQCGDPCSDIVIATE